MKDTDYTFAVARIRANEKKLLTNADVENLIALKGLNDAFSYLSSKGWITEDGKLSVSDVLSIQNKALWKLLCESVPEKKELEVFTVQNDFYNIKAALKCAFESRQAEIYFVFPTSLDLNVLAEAAKSHKFELLEKQYGVAMKEAYEKACMTENGQSADIILDRAALDFLQKKSESAKCEMLRKIAGFITACADIKIAVRCARTGKSFSFCEQALAKCEDLDTKKLAELCEKGEKDIFAYLKTTELSKGAQLIETDTAAFEKWCDDTVTEITREAKFKFFSFEPIVAYYYMKQAEIKTVRIILTAKENGLSENIIRERVRALYA